MGVYHFVIYLFAIGCGAGRPVVKLKDMKKIKCVIKTLRIEQRFRASLKTGKRYLIPLAASCNKGKMSTDCCRNEKVVY